MWIEESTPLQTTRSRTRRAQLTLRMNPASAKGVRAESDVIRVAPAVLDRKKTAGLFKNRLEAQKPEATRRRRKFARWQTRRAAGSRSLQDEPARRVDPVARSSHHRDEPMTPQRARSARGWR